MKKEIYLKHDELTYEVWHSLAIIGSEYYDVVGYDKLSRQEISDLFNVFKIKLDNELLTMLHDCLESRGKG